MVVWYVFLSGDLHISLIITSVINGVISFPIAVLAYFFLPDTPGTAKPNWIFTEQVGLNDQMQSIRLTHQ